MRRERSVNRGSLAEPGEQLCLGLAVVGPSETPAGVSAGHIVRSGSAELRQSGQVSATGT